MVEKYTNNCLYNIKAVFDLPSRVLSKLVLKSHKIDKKIGAKPGTSFKSPFLTGCSSSGNIWKIKKLF
jgi:hypothetical protein